MKIVHVDVTTDVKIVFPHSFLVKLPETIGLFMTTQYISQVSALKDQLEKAGKKVLLFQTRHTPFPGQILGCNVEQFPGVDGFVYVGDGLFHPQALVEKNKKPVFVFDPLTKKTSVIDEDEAVLAQKKRLARLALFTRARAVGVLITVKSGQYGIEVDEKRRLFGIERYLALERMYPDKKFYFLVANDISLQSLADFNFLDFLVNTACPRIALDDYAESRIPMLNMHDIEGGAV